MFGLLSTHTVKVSLFMQVDYRVDESSADPQGMITYRACKPIREGEELCIFYGGDIWFEDGHAVE